MRNNNNILKTLMGGGGSFSSGGPGKGMHSRLCKSRTHCICSSLVWLPWCKLTLCGCFSYCFLHFRIVLLAELSSLFFEVLIISCFKGGECFVEKAKFTVVSLQT